MNEEIFINKRKQFAISPREVILKYLKYLPWIAISIAVMMLLAYVKLRYSTKIYNVTGKLLVKTPTPNMGAEKFDDIFMMQGNRNLNDEIEIIKSTAIGKRVVDALGLRLRFYNKGKIRSTVVHQRELPFDISILKVSDSTSGFSLFITILNDNEFKLNENTETYYFNQVVSTPEVEFQLNRNSKNWRTFASNQFMIASQTPEDVATELSGTIKVSLLGDFTNVLTLEYETENPRMGIDIINQYMYEYQSASLEDKREIAVKTLEFIDEQLDTVRYELTGVEFNLQNYREKNRVFNPQQQMEIFFNEQSDNNKVITEQEVKLKVIDYLIAHISDMGNLYRTVPSSLGIQEPSLIQQITEYNNLQLQRETSLKTTPQGNPLIRNLEVGIEKLRLDMLANLRNVRQTYLVTLANLNRKSSRADAEIKSIPGKEKQLQEVTRQQNILQELYSYLLQKRLETSIASASTISNIRVVEPAAYVNSPIKPNRRGSYVIAIFLALAIPAGIIFLIEYLNDKVKSKMDIQSVTEAPIIGEVGHSEESGALVVTKNNRKFIAEQFRIIRSNMQYILPKEKKPILLVTSSFSGEGKSFISTNLGAVLALSGKRTVILEFDIRKPKIIKGLGINQRKGITNYIIGNVDLEEIIQPVPAVPNLFVIPCGPVPPNPAEMLLDEKIGQLFQELRQQFETIIVDTAPIGLVSDAVTLSNYANATMYIVRHNYTLKKQVQLIEDLYSQRKVPYLSIIINDIKVSAGYGGDYAYSGYGYGYGYGYNYGSDYFEKDNKLNGTSWLGKIHSSIFK